MTKYVVSGYIGFDNFGDELIARVLTDKLKRDGAEKITLISSNPEKTAKLHGVDSCGMLKFFKPLQNADVLISGGGSLLQDVTSLKSLIYYLGVIYTALFLRKKVEVFAQGIGPIRSKIGQFFTKQALKRTHKISVRDKKSQELLNSWGIEAELVKDPAFDLELTAGQTSGVVGIQLRDFPTVTDEFLNSLAYAVREKYSDKKIKVISLQDSVDLELCKKFAGLLNRDDVEVLSGLSINDVIETISGLECLIAMRFHANVVAIKCGVKTTAINYDIKVQKLAEEYNLPLIELNEAAVNI